MMEEVNEEIETAVLEDDMDHRIWVEEEFRRAGIWPFALFATYAEMKQDMPKNRQLFVLDFRLTGEVLTVIEIIREIRDVNKAAYFIIMSGQTDKNVVVQLLNVKADYYVDKDKWDWLPELSAAVKEGILIVKTRNAIIAKMEQKILSMEERKKLRTQNNES